MHPLILGAGLGLLALGPSGLLAARATPARPVPQAACPAAGAAVLERFFTADCADCWAQAIGPAGPDQGAAERWVFDWIVPAHPAAPLAAGALPESAERATRGGVPALSSERTSERHQAPQSTPAGQPLRASAGPAWQGYFGAQLSLRRLARQPLPPGSTGWLALVEIVAAGSDGSAARRALVRSVAGPLPLDTLAAQPAQKALTHLRALRWPAGAEPTRLQARAWIEGPDGTILAVAADQCR